MVSTAAGWDDGRESWSVTHDAQVDLKHLEVRGEPPREFARIRDELFAKQTEDTCDYIFDIPVEVAAEVVGFRYDERQEVSFNVLKRSSLFRRMLRK